MKRGSKQSIDKVETQSGKLTDKPFEARESALTELLKDKNIASVYNIFVALFLGTCINSLVNNYLHKGELARNPGLILWCFRRFDKFILVWICHFSSTLGVFLGFNCWAQLRLRLNPKSILLLLWDGLWIGCFMLYVVGLLYFSTMIVTNNDFGFATAIATLCEMTRFLMKGYGFIRTNAPRFLGRKSVRNSPKFVQYLYYLFAPTLIYQDEYPRSKGDIRWRLVAAYFLEFLVTIYFSSIVVEQSYVMSLRDYGMKSYGWQDITIIIVQYAGHSMLCFFIFFYMILHLWQNAFAEMLKFSDRMFYADWWTSSSYGRYYATWNCVVHNWLYTFIYKDFYETIVPKNKVVAKVMVFFVSALFHEIIVSVSAGFFLPTFTIQFFMLGTLFSFIKFKNHFFGNIFLIYTLGLGSSMMYTFNFMEYYSRVNCAKERVLTIESFFTPKLLICNSHSQ